MSVEHYFTEAIVIRRLTEIDSTHKSFVATGTVDAHMAQLTDVQAGAGEFGTAEVTHKAWVDINANIKIGDKVFDADNVEYDVLGINEKGRGIAMNEHLACWLSKKVDGEQ